MYLSINKFLIFLATCSCFLHSIIKQTKGHMNSLEQEKQLIKKAKIDKRYFANIYDQYYNNIFGYILKRVANPALAQDITSEVFYKAMANLWKFKWKNISISSWLYRIATNEVNYYFRKSKYHSLSLDKLIDQNGLEIPDPNSLQNELIEAEDILQQHKEFVRIQKYIATLPIHYQEVITLKYFENKSIKEISLILNKKEGTIKSLLSRGMSKLKEAFN